MPELWESLLTIVGSFVSGVITYYIIGWWINRRRLRISTIIDLIEELKQNREHQEASSYISLEEDAYKRFRQAGFLLEQQTELADRLRQLYSRIHEKNELTLLYREAASHGIAEKIYITGGPQPRRLVDVIADLTVQIRNMIVPLVPNLEEALRHARRMGFWSFLHYYILFPPIFLYSVLAHEVGHIVVGNFLGGGGIKDTAFYPVRFFTGGGSLAYVTFQQPVTGLSHIITGLAGGISSALLFLFLGITLLYFTPNRFIVIKVILFLVGVWQLIDVVNEVFRLDLPVLPIAWAFWLFGFPVYQFRDRLVRGVRTLLRAENKVANNDC